jgi:hypothetical protein
LVGNRPFAHSAKLSGHKGRIAIVTDAGRDAVDAAASAREVMAGQAGSACERSNGALTNNVFADGKAVWSWHPLLVSSWRRQVGPTGFDKTLIRR